MGRLAGSAKPDGGHVIQAVQSAKAAATRCSDRAPRGLAKRACARTLSLRLTSERSIRAAGMDRIRAKVLASRRILPLSLPEWLPR